jgi:hypothetical protein
MSSAAWQKSQSLVVGFVHAGGGRHKVAINGGGAMKLQAVCRSVEVQGM